MSTRVSPTYTSEVSDAKRTLPPTGVVPEPIALQEPAQRPHLQLVRDTDRLVPGRLGPRLVHRGEHAVRDLDVGLAPRRGERVAQLEPVLRLAQRAVADPEAQSFEGVVGLDEVCRRCARSAVFLRDRRKRLWGAFEWGGDDVGNVAGGQRVATASPARGRLH